MIYYSAYLAQTYFIQVNIYKKKQKKKQCTQKSACNISRKNFVSEFCKIVLITQ